MVDRVPFAVIWNEDCSALLLGRLVGPLPSGSATGVPGEGYWLKQAAISTITYSIQDVTAGTQVIGSTSITVSSAVVDTPVTSSVLWTRDATGYNFSYTLPTTSFPTGSHEYKVEIVVTTTGGFVSKGEWQGIARPSYIS